MDKVLLDTDILSEFLRGKNADVENRGREYLAEHGRFTISVLTVLEVVRARHHAGQHQHAARFLEWTRNAEVVAVDAACAIRAGEVAGALYKPRQPIPVTDLLIGATALVRGLIAVTSDARRYEHLKPFGLRVATWRDG